MTLGELNLPSFFSDIEAKGGGEQVPKPGLHQTFLICLCSLTLIRFASCHCWADWGFSNSLLSRSEEIDLLFAFALLLFPLSEVCLASSEKCRVSTYIGSNFQTFGTITLTVNQNRLLVHIIWKVLRQTLKKYIKIRCLSPW